MGILSSIEQFILRSNPINILGQFTTSKKGITFGPKQNSIGRGYSQGVDAYIDSGRRTRSSTLEACIGSPFDHFTFDKDGLTFGPGKNKVGQLKDNIIAKIV